MWVSQNPCSGWRLAQTLLDSPLTSGLPDGACGQEELVCYLIICWASLCP